MVDSRLRFIVTRFGLPSPSPADPHAKGALSRDEILTRKNDLITTDGFEAFSWFSSIVNSNTKSADLVTPP